MRSKVLAPICALLLLVAGCGDDDVTTTEAAATTETAATTDTAATTEAPATTAAPTTTAAPSAQCSATGLALPGEQADLPAVVAGTRDAVVVAAAACDYVTLTNLAGPIPEEFAFSVDTALDAGGFLQELETSGGQPLAGLLELLDTPFGVITDTGPEPLYVWPSAFAYPTWAEVPEAEREALRSLLGTSFDFVADLDMYIGPRVGITESGDWTFYGFGDAATGGQEVSALQVTQVGFDTDFQGGWVVLENTGGAPVSLAGHFLCQRPDYFALPDVQVGPGEFYWVATGDFSDLGTAPGVGADGALGVFAQASGEVGLYSSQSFGDPSAILSYVEWGESGHGRSSVAVEAGIWATGDFVEVPDALTGAISVIDAAAPPGGANWFPIEAP